MARTVFQTLLLMLVIAASVEGVIDRSTFGHPHGDEPHEVVNIDVDEPVDSTSVENHCEHCCHGHASCITTVACALSEALLATQTVVGRDDDIRTLVLTPPTPPPNA